MADEDIDSGLFNISLGSDIEDGDGEAQGQQKTSSTSRADRTGQSEEQFQAVKRAYRAKIENGEIWKSDHGLPLGRRKVSKQEATELLHAVEELYFYRRFADGVTLVDKMFEGEGGGEGLDKDTRETLHTYAKKCREKME